LFLGPATALAGRDRTKPTQPANFRVTAKSAYRVSLAWNPSSDNSGSFTYQLWSTAGPAITLPKTATSFTWTAGLHPRNSYTFGIYAVDAAGNVSAQSSLSATTPADTTPPSTAPILSVTDVGSTYVTLAWIPAQDDGPYLFYEVWVDGVPRVEAGTNTSITVSFLDPQTTYTFNVIAHDYGQNASPVSAPVSVTTEAPDPSDTTPPTTPANFTDYGMSFPDGETWLFWQQSTDNADPQAVLRYDLYVNGALNQSLVGTDRTILYVDPSIPNTFDLVAVDTAGNPSAPATLTIFIGH
jgi:chitinase